MMHANCTLSYLVPHDTALPMRTRVTNRGQVSIPAAIRRKLRITANTALEWIDEGQEQAESAVRLLDAAGVEWVSCEPAILEEAARMKAGGGLSVADAWIAATAAVREAVLVHKDREFARVRQVRQERLRR